MGGRLLEGRPWQARRRIGKASLGAGSSHYWIAWATRRVGREEILSCHPASRGEPAHVSCHYQGAMDLRAGSSATERGTRSRSLRRTILERPSSSRAHDNDRLRVPPASPSHQSEAGKKE